MSNDKYRKAIFNAQVFANSGAATYEQAVDSAVKEMLTTGLNCDKYKNGARHTLSDYAEMAIRTANKRAYLRSEGEKAQEWGISTVIINRRNGACGKCADFVGMVFIDDVYAGGKKTDEGGKYPILSEAISAGLFHPRCKDSSSLYIEGISTLPDKEVLPKKAQEELFEIERLEQKANYGNRKQKMYSRLAKYALDSDNKTAYTAKAKRWKKYTDFWTEKYEKRLENTIKSGIIKLKDSSIVSGAISGALNPDGKQAKEHAKQYYKSVRKMKTDYKRIAKNTGFSVDEIKEIKENIFLDKHDLRNGKLEYFVPSYDMAESWQRLIDGKNIQPHDLVLLNHEIMEKDVIHKGLTQDEAHK